MQQRRKNLRNALNQYDLKEYTVTWLMSFRMLILLVFLSGLKLLSQGVNHSKLAAKQPKRPNCTKAENRSKTVKKAKKNENCLELIFRTKYQNTFFLTKNKFFDQTVLISV